MHGAGAGAPATPPVLALCPAVFRFTLPCLSLRSLRKMHDMLQKVLEDTCNVSVPWIISFADLAPPSMAKVASAPDPPSNRPSSRGPHGSRSSGPVGINKSTMPPAPRPGRPIPRPTLVGASGSLPYELATGGRWFARTVGDGAILLTFLPAFKDWKDDLSSRLEQQRGKRKKWKRPGRRSGAAGVGRKGRGGGRHGREDDSLGLFLFLVRLGDFGLPIEPHNAMLQDVRSILMAQIPQSHHQAMAFKPSRR